MVNKKLLTGIAALAAGYAVYSKLKSTSDGSGVEDHGTYQVFHIKDDLKPELVFYVPKKVSNNCAVIMYPGFGRSPADYHRAGEMVAEDGMLGVITEWHDDGRFTERTMIESVYYPVDFIRKEIKHDGKVVGVGHSFGGDRLLKAAVLDKEGRFDGVAAVQPPERLLKYTKNHPVLYHGVKIDYIRVPLTWYAGFMYPPLHVSTTQDGEWLRHFIDNESSLSEFIRNAPDGYSTPTQIIYSPEDDHVSHEDALRAKEELSKKGPAIIEEVKLPRIEAVLTDRNIEMLFREILVFNAKVARDEYKQDENEAYRSALNVDMDRGKIERPEIPHAAIELLEDEDIFGRIAKKA